LRLPGKAILSGFIELCPFPEVAMSLFPIRHVAAALFLCGSVSVAQAEVRTVDPSAAALTPVANTAQPAAVTSAPGATASPDINADLAPVEGASNAATTTQDATSATTTAPPAAPGMIPKDDVISAAEGVFGKGAKGLAELVEKVLKDQGQPNAYIAGREASGAFVVGLRYGSGTMTHSVEGQRPVYWTGPSLGFDFGGDAAKVFVLVYNLYDSQDLFKRYPQIEGRAYFVGGFSGTYLRRGNVALIPIRLGVGVRLGANIGYMKFSEKSKWLPF
jgi:hypothetical protein